MARKPPPTSDPVIRKTVSLPESDWLAINEMRRATPGLIPSENEVIRTLLREALAARAKTTTKRTKP